MKFECSRRALVITCAGAPTLSSAVEDMDDEFAKMLDDLEEVPEETSSPGSQPIADEVICLLGEEEPTSSLPSSSSSSPPNKTSSFVKVTARTRPAARRRGERKPGVRGVNAYGARAPFDRRSSEKLVPLMPDSHAHDFPCVLALPQSAKRKRTIKQKVIAPLPVPLWPQYSLTWKCEPIEGQKWITVGAKEHWLVRLCDSMTNMSYKEVVKKVVDKFSVGLSDPTLVRHAPSVGRGSDRARGGSDRDGKSDRGWAALRCRVQLRHERCSPEGRIRKGHIRS